MNPSSASVAFSASVRGHPPPPKCPRVSEGGKAQGGCLGVNGAVDQGSASCRPSPVSYRCWTNPATSAVSDPPSPPAREKDALRRLALNIHSSGFPQTEISSAALSSWMPAFAACSLHQCSAAPAALAASASPGARRSSAVSSWPPPWSSAGGLVGKGFG